MAIKRWNANTSTWELVGTPGTVTPAAIGAAALVGNNTFTGNIVVNGSNNAIESSNRIRTKEGFRVNAGNNSNEYQIGPFYNFTDFHITHSTDNFTSHTPRLTIDTSGNILIGTLQGAGKLRVNQSGQSTTAHFENTNSSWASDVVTSYSPNGVEASVLGISARSTGETWITSSYNNLIFRVGSGNANVTEAMRIIPGGVGNQPYLGIATTQDGGVGGTWGRLAVRTDNNNINGIKVVAGASDFYNRLIEMGSIRSNSSAFSYISGYSSVTGSSDVDFYIRGDGNGYSDGTWNGGGADYAEYFEWADANPSNEDRRGYSVSLINNKIKIAEEGEVVIGVISGNPSVVGDHANMMWSNKYLRDDYGSYIRDENGERILNPEFDSEVEYVSREDRPEWAIVGLMGKLRLRKGQITGAGWIKMRDISSEVEEWLVK